MNPKPIYVVDIFRDIVQKVSDKVTPQLIAFDNKITGVHYQHGHPKEIMQTLGEYSKSPQLKFSRYPIVALFQDFPENRADNPGLYGEIILHLIVARVTDNTFKATQRYSENFKPVLYPVYAELMKQIHYSPAFLTQDETLIEHTKIDRLYWGREGLWGNEGNIFNDFVDCIEIRDLKLKVNLKYC